MSYRNRTETTQQLDHIYYFSFSQPCIFTSSSLTSSPSSLHLLLYSSSSSSRGPGREAMEEEAREEEAREEVSSEVELSLE